MAKWLWLILLLLAGTGCGQRRGPNQSNVDKPAIMRSAKSLLPIAVEMETLNPVTYHDITNFNNYGRPNYWNSVSFFGGKYKLHMQVAIEIDFDKNRVVKMLEEPTLYLYTVSRIVTHSDGRADASFVGSDQRKLGVEQWNKFYNAGGDVTAVGLAPSTEPVKDFDAYVAQHFDGRRPLSLINLPEEP